MPSGVGPRRHASHVRRLTSCAPAAGYLFLWLREGYPMALEIALKAAALLSGFGLAFIVNPLLPF